MEEYDCVSIISKVITVLVAPFVYYFMFTIFLWCFNWEISTIKYDNKNIIVIKEKYERQEDPC